MSASEDVTPVNGDEMDIIVPDAAPVDAGDSKKEPESDVDWKAQRAADDENIQNLLAKAEEGQGIGINFNDDTPFDQTDKADNAEDYEDISDDDLPEEEEATGATSLSVPGLTDDGGTSNDTDDLFGDGPSSPIEPAADATSPRPHIHDPEDPESYRDLNFNTDPSSLATNQDPDIPLLPRFWRAYQEKAFRVPGPAATTRKQRLIAAELSNLVDCSVPDPEDEDGKEDVEIDFESDSETVGGFTLQDIDMVCDDWAVHIDHTEKEFETKVAAQTEAENVTGHKRAAVDDDQSDDDWDALFLKDDNAVQPRKKVRIPLPAGLPDISRFTAPSFDLFQEMTKRGAKRVVLDMNDPYLLLEETESQRGPKRQRTEKTLIRMASGHSKPDIFQRFNLSNDEAYEALKENHKHKVRATLGNLGVEHSMPALRLAWPYYKVKLDIRGHGYHRPNFRFNKHERQTIKFDKLTYHKRKTKKGKAHEVFQSTKDLGITDNCTAVLFEYCERTPPVLSNFGMGNRVINYYRKRQVDEEEVPPKMDVGESHVLHPEDRSPFAIFGEVKAGQTMPTLHNQMYRAPIFKHQPRSTDFLCVRSSTGVEGSKWYIHNIDHLYVVGQTFPSVEVPGPHSRKVTNASKNRIKMMSYRMMRRSPHSVVNLADITKHIAESTDAQNRQKLKEFLVYAKMDKGQWKLKPGETLMDEAGIRAMVKPEDVCLIDGMQLGMQILEDAGFDPNNVNLDEDNDDVEEEDDDRTAKGGKKAADKNEDKLADKMAPWKTSKAFIDACAGKAMLKLHGEGDPTGHGLGFSFIRTSMKGGYIETVQKGGSHTTAADAMAAHPDAMRKAYNGHAYNVKEQEVMYKKGIHEIWEKQKASLGDGSEKDDSLVVPPPADEDDRFNTHVSQTPAHVDEGASQITGLTSNSRTHHKRLKITRDVKGEDGTIEQRVVILDDPVIIDRYIKRRREKELDELKADPVVEFRSVKNRSRKPSAREQLPPPWNTKPFKFPCKVLRRSLDKMKRQTVATRAAANAKRLEEAKQAVAAATARLKLASQRPAKPAPPTPGLARTNSMPPSKVGGFKNTMTLDRQPKRQRPSEPPVEAASNKRHRHRNKH
ncbi:transcription initiation factor TFIID subunit 1 [Verticillium alfalfae VaMs.102]|uniref:Transcription initiation factor TFIID subunit 1 n=1 Tax=Verticillium alfalfae (strain VaMs.102 / ATCC MYA-4576 / FGSC 10136) TaxID=526221 RepID=C9SH05_VERA1|nr:transcription initiation factor TFIID subunit 1 [Verticillium alfalfae VaMs.102]EEY17599.1 transcription initiation factor TFIID subunit 1 [Verticillium alfalfae VaMs.102]